MNRISEKLLWVTRNLCKYKLVREPKILNNNFNFVYNFSSLKNYESSYYYNKQNVRNSFLICGVGGILTFLGLKEKTPEEKESELITIMKRGILLIQKEEFKKAEQMLHIALKVAQEQMNFDAITYIYDLLANLALDTGDFDKAEKLFVNVLQRLLSEKTEADDNKVIHICLKLAKISEIKSDTKKAEEGYRFCIENLEAKVNERNDHSEDTLALWGMCLDTYAHFLLATNRVREAFSCFKKAYDKCVEVNGKAHEQSVVLLNDLGTVANMLGNSDTAVSYLEEAVAIGDKLPEMKVLGSIYVNLGQMYLLKKMYSQSRDACETGKTLAKKNEDKEEEKEADICLQNVQKVLLS